jgi:transcriptional regulator with XRE-family HTH domain
VNAPILLSRHLSISLRDMRAAAGLTQKELAQKSGVDEKSISSWETGRRVDSLKISQLNKLVIACDLTLFEFLTNFVDPGRPRRRFRRGLQDYVTDLVVLLSEAEGDGHHPLDVAFRALGQIAPASHEQQRGVAV